MRGERIGKGLREIPGPTRIYNTELYYKMIVIIIICKSLKKKTDSPHVTSVLPSPITHRQRLGVKFAVVYTQDARAGLP